MPQPPLSMHQCEIYWSNFIILPIILAVCESIVRKREKLINVHSFVCSILIVSIGLFSSMPMLYQHLWQYYVIHMIIFLLRYVYLNTVDAFRLWEEIAKRGKKQRTHSDNISNSTNNNKTKMTATPQRHKIEYEICLLFSFICANQ